MEALVLRGVCIGVNRHVAAGERVDLDPQLFQFLASIRAVEAAPAKPAEVPTAEPEQAPAGKKGK